MIIAHRAGRPENTIDSFKNCVLNCVKAIEFDVHLTNDNEIIVYHDFEVNGQKISISNYADIISSSPEIPKLQDVLDCVLLTSVEHGLPLPILNVEVKPWGISTEISLFIKDYCRNNEKITLENFVFTSFIHSEILKIRDFLPNVRLGFIYSCWPMSIERTLKENSIDLLVLNDHTFDENEISDLQKSNVDCWVYTVNNDDRLMYLIDDLKICGVITDLPVEMKNKIVSLI